MAAQIQDERIPSEESNTLLLVDGPSIGLHPQMLSTSKERLRTAEDKNLMNTVPASPKKKATGSNAAANVIDSDH